MPTIWRSTISSRESTLDLSFSKVCTLQVVLDWLDKPQLYGLECFWCKVRVWAWHPNSWSGRFCKSCSLHTFLQVSTPTGCLNEGLHLSCWMSPVAVSKKSNKTHGFTAGQGQEENDWPKLSSRIVSLWSTRWKHVMDNGRGWEVKHPQSTKESKSQVPGATMSRDCGKTWCFGTNFWCWGLWTSVIADVLRWSLQTTNVLLDVAIAKNSKTRSFLQGLGWRRLFDTWNAKSSEQL